MSVKRAAKLRKPLDLSDNWLFRINCVIADRGVCTINKYCCVNGGKGSMETFSTYDPEDYYDELIGADASHAWISIFVPDTGWVDLDPTNNLIPGDNHITLAWGRDYGRRRAHAVRESGCENSSVTTICSGFVYRNQLIIKTTEHLWECRKSPRLSKSHGKISIYPKVGIRIGNTPHGGFCFAKNLT